jgi:hypothetical protein
MISIHITAIRKMMNILSNQSLGNMAPVTFFSWSTGYKHMSDLYCILTPPLAVFLADRKISNDGQMVNPKSFNDNDDGKNDEIESLGCCSPPQISPSTRSELLQTRLTHKDDDDDNGVTNNRTLLPSKTCSRAESISQG